MQNGTELATHCSMKHKARWAVTLAAAALMVSVIVLELAGDTMTQTFDSMAAHPIARMLAIGNALTIVP